MIGRAVDSGQLNKSALVAFLLPWDIDRDCSDLDIFASNLF